MTACSALILQNPGLHRSIAASSLPRLGYVDALELSCENLALQRLRESGGADLLLCDLRAAPAARLALLRTAAREQLVRAVVITGELPPGIWPALARLLDLQGVYARYLGNEPATHERLQKALGQFDPLQARAPALPTLCELPAEQEVIAALSRGEIRAALQPKISVSSGATCGFEVLARWQRQDGSLLPPSAFLPTLRRHGLLDALLFELLDQAVTLLRAHGRDDLGLAFNLDPVQLAEPGFGAWLEQQLQRLGADPGRITFELTESGLLQAPAISLDNLLHLRLLGCGLAIDDFGSGQSTLQRLLELPFTELKLDASFLAGLDEEPHRQSVLASAVALGRALALPVVAEGVENAGQLQHLQGLGCERVQGFHLGRPLMAGDLEGWLRGAETTRRRCWEISYESAGSFLHEPLQARPRLAP